MPHDHDAIGSASSRTAKTEKRLSPPFPTGEGRLHKPEGQQALTGVKLGQPQSVHGAIRPILENKVLFGVNLYEAGLAEKVERMLSEMLAGPGRSARDAEKGTAIRRDRREAVGAAHA